MCAKTETYCGCNFEALKHPKGPQMIDEHCQFVVGDKQLLKINNGLNHTRVTLSKYQLSVEQDIVPSLLRSEFIFPQLNQTTEAVQQTRGSRFLLGIVMHLCILIYPME